ncbi:MAG: bifunctional sulfate adenylyltransferase/adenylylsulfate kinase [Planctomycetes bacterium]|nr:bifunctional sulfate adenylyltransferase/adenylylsulfate kinase [Planctomycetota bacterium]
MDHLIEPHGGTLVNLLVDGGRAAELRAASRDWPSWSLTPRQLCDLELLLNGGFSPLQGFMTRADYESVRDDMRLRSGLLWPVPVTLDLSEELAKELRPGAHLALRDGEGFMLAVLHVEEVWRPDLGLEARRVYGSDSLEHPGVRALLEECRPCCAGGRLEGIQLPIHYDFRAERLAPHELRREFERQGWRRVVAFATQSPMHRAQHEMTLCAAKLAQANVLIQPVVGPTEVGDLEHYTRVHCYQALLAHFPQHTAKLAVLPLALRLAGPREALWRALVHKNHGCTHVIVEPGQPLELARARAAELGVDILPFESMAYVEDLDACVPESEVPPGARVLHVSDADLRRRLDEGREIPEWFTFPEVAAVLRHSYPPRRRQGFTVFLTGLSGAGKSTVANVLLVKFLEMGGRPVTLLDGDIVRRHLSSELGFSREHRDINIRRIGFVAAEITKNGGIAICAPIAPYRRVRREVRQMVEKGGGFILVHVRTPLEVCEQRDRKGLYAKARAGIVKEFTGISDPYEEPEDADVVLDTSELTPEQAAQEVLLHLERQGYVGVDGGA